MSSVPPQDPGRVWKIVILAIIIAIAGIGYLLTGN
jgi:hypothetical protein